MLDALTAREIELLNGLSFGAKEAGLGTKLAAIISAAAQDPGHKAVNTLRLATDVVGATTVTIGSDVYEVNVVNTDTTVDSDNDELNNTTNPVSVTIPSHGLSEGDLIRCENEIMKVRGSVSVDVVVVSRGHSGTTNAAHADGNSIYKAGTPATGTRKEVGLVTTLTNAAFGAALVAVINSEGTEPVVASVVGDTEVLLTAKAVGVQVTACTETLAGSNNVFAAAAMYGGRAATARRISIQQRVPNATEVALGNLHAEYDFTPLFVLVLVAPTATPGAWKIFDGVPTISTSHVTIDKAGSTDWAATDTVTIIAIG